MNKTALLVVASLAVAAAVGGVYWMSHRQASLPPSRQPAPAPVPASSTSSKTTKNDIATAGIGLAQSLVTAWSSSKG